MNNDPKLARATRKKILIAKGLSRTANPGMNSFILLQSKTCICIRYKYDYVLTDMWHPSKIARARRKQVLIAKGLSKNSTKGINSLFPSTHRIETQYIDNKTQYYSHSHLYSLSILTVYRYVTNPKYTRATISAICIFVT